MSVVNGPSTTSNAFGAFTLSGVAAGPVLVNVSAPTFKTTSQAAGVAYSTTQLALTVAANQSVSVFPVLHQGCYEVGTAQAAGSVSLSDEGISCGAFQPGAQGDLWASISYGATSFTVPSTGELFNGTPRIEIIPIGFPLNSDSATDFTWALGLPGASTPLTTIGAAEFRVVDDATNEPLAITANDTSVVATIATWKLASTTTYAPYAYSATAGSWGPAPGATLGNAVKEMHGNTPAINTVDLQHVEQLGWLSVTSAGAPTTCVTGTITAGGSPAPGVWVHTTGLNYLGASSAVTGSNGTFCLDVAAQAVVDAGVDAGPVPTLGVSAGYVSTGSAFYSLPTTSYPSAATAGATCASGCAAGSIGTIALTPFNSTCVSGTAPGVSAPTLTVDLVNLPVSAAQQRDGMENEAYIGTTTLGDGGAFCAQATNGEITLSDPSCTSGEITVDAGAAATCGGGGCTSVGQIAVCL